MATRSRNCVQCNRQFEYEIRRGADRWVCSPECRTERDRIISLETCKMHRCEVVGCTNHARPGSRKICEMHYSRLRRNGVTESIKPPALVEHTHGYLLAYAPTHPLSTGRRARVYEHRKVFYDAHGDGPFKCHVCGNAVTWDTMHVDHLDDDPKNNTLNNLAPACPECNQWRGRDKMVAKQRAKGRQIVAFGETRCIADWARTVGLPITTLNRRLKDGWAPELALKTPPGPTGRKCSRAKA